jgi:transcriptional regulator
MDDPAWVRTLVERLTNRYEEGRAVPWKVTDAPADFIDRMVSATSASRSPLPD